MLTALTDNVWTATQPLKILGFNLGSKMTIVRMADGGLWLHSPIKPDDALVAAVRELGEVRHIVSPNLLHHLSIPDWAARFPEARVWADPDLAKKQPDLSLEDLGDAVPEAMGGEFEMVNVRGMPVVRERVFLHRPSQTLVQTDMVFNLDDAGWITNTYLSICGIRGKVGSSYLLKTMTKDKAEARKGIDAVLEWDWQHMTVNHGECVSTDAKERFREGMTWLKA